MALTVIIGCIAFFKSPTQNHYNPANKHHAASENGYSETIASMPQKIDPVAQATQTHTTAEKEKYVVERSDLAAQWAMAQYTFVGVALGGMGLFSLY